MQKAKYIVPSIFPTKSYVIEYENIDVAVGFETPEELKKYIDDLEIEKEYDYIFIDVDSNEKFNIFDIKDCEKRYFVTAFDSFSLKKGIEVIGKIDEKIKMKKVLFSADFYEENDEYLNLLTVSYPIEWDKEKIYFPYDQTDITAIIENQRVTKIKFRNLTEEFREGLLALVHEIAPEIKANNLKKVFKTL